MLDTASTNQFASLILALAIVAVAIALCAALAFYLKRRFNFTALGQKLMPNSRLAVIESINVDQKRKLILIQKDNTEHLVMVGGPTDLVIETKTPERPQEHRQKHQQAPQPAPEPNHNIASHAPVQSPISTSETQSASLLASGVPTSGANDPGSAIDTDESGEEAPIITTEQEAIDVFDKARDRIFASNETKQQNPKSREDTDDFQSILQSQQREARNAQLQKIPESGEERVSKLKALLDEAQKARERRS